MKGSSVISKTITFSVRNKTDLGNKLLAVGVYGNMYKVIRCLYSKLQSAVRLSPTMFTEWFSVDSGVRQGDNLAPTLFALFIDELVPLINGLCCGALIGDDMISCLLYADDLVLISGTVDGLQNQLNALNDWTKTQLMNVNTEKTKIMHIRKTTKDRTQFTFRLGDNIVAFVNKYRYLGLTLSEHIDYNVSVSELVSAGSRSLGSLISKFFNMGNMDYDIFTKIYENTVIPVLDYASGVWGAKQYDNIERLHYRAIRTFLGVGKTTPIPAILADMGWHPVFIHNQCNVVRLWCRLMNMPGHRICRKVFVWDRDMSRRYRNTWFNSAKTLLDRCNLSHLTENDSAISTRFILDSVKSKLVADFKDKWFNEINNMPKLRTYKHLKTEFYAEPYVQKHLTRTQRSAIARIRCGTFPLEVERGRYRNIPIEQRVCKMCNSGSIEDEQHFILYCDRYSVLRNKLFTAISPDPAYPLHINELPPNAALNELLSNNNKSIANFILDCDRIRREII
ncbi:unnamed protein product [Mytilus edulis]|uniref:Reverse transcriptase domain-containing protein n=1 Tax=Mytilus edulis TaxID=6550 RepID=A0A8S3TVR7_MYTED|nr:unnamed protein product [Mytilus edulis]